MRQYVHYELQEVIKKNMDKESSSPDDSNNDNNNNSTNDKWAKTCSKKCSSRTLAACHCSIYQTPVVVENVDNEEERKKRDEKEIGICVCVRFESDSIIIYFVCAERVLAWKQ